MVEDKDQGGETLRFEAEVAKLLSLMVHSVYSNRDVFLRELISNAADACEKLRMMALQQPDLLGDDPDFKIVLSADKTGGTLTIADNGIGMDRAELVENLGTIARSGTRAFLDGMSGGERLGPDRPVRRRLLFRLHGRLLGRGRLAARRLRTRPGAGGRTAPAPSSSSPCRSRKRRRAARGSC